MNPDAQQLWRAPRWALAVLLAVLGMLGPFSIDTYIPAFAGIAQSLGATPVQMQQTLSAYLFGFAFMSLFHGAISDSVGRRPVVLWGLAAFALASLGCALSQSIGQLIFFRAVQGLTTGAGIVVSRAVVRDMFAPAQAQKVMSQITIYFGVAPAVAPMIGGVLFASLGWHSVFWFLTLVGVVLWAANYRLLPETLHVTQRQPLNVRNLLQGYWQLGLDPRFLLLALASGIPFNGMFLYVLSAPAFLGVHLALAPTQFFWFFVLTISGIMGGAWVSGRMAGRLAPKQQIKYGFLIMLGIALLNLLLNALFKAHVSWALFPVMIFAFGWALMVPVVTLLVLDLHPDRRGMASSLQAFIGASANGLVAGVVAPLVMHSTLALAGASLSMMSVGLLAWLGLHQRWPDIGRSV
ncbi:MAG: multidrug effflux MFS transporter [Rhodoferax sp.]|nr:multidrug effflux MFS transporter [Rhodoferax sp.]OIP21371.1 MAG: Bcr/CflA family drug resistance efflux transporter [Comamonadaceae bacterium CG2_30_60_41]PIW10238.1 MAG: Bcr/CflA family drug resistance efflux transporter [Comamonadaceae bacterium CG17_big_fil_post_rev_8_21_14_2_50_60_13]PIY26671.1 MAG: Bcr/CflA family drug resistance efflux transporter [Comamonadaceae bacterium CG_4_10_14_3_um_filter_60_75]PJC14059.1 MAG: Bcr/CflA family drug resistance efflux transporter [Comamonadaceae b